jgi:hypothetical protein
MKFSINALRFFKTQMYLFLPFTASGDSPIVPSLNCALPLEHFKMFFKFFAKIIVFVRIGKKTSIADMTSTVREKSEDKQQT